MRVGICVCTYKRDDLLMNLINSLLEQKYVESLDYEIIIVDNYGKSDIQKRLKSLNARINILYYVEESKGISYARNKCLAVAKSKDYNYK